VWPQRPAGARHGPASSPRSPIAIQAPPRRRPAARRPEMLALRRTPGLQVSASFSSTRLSALAPHFFRRAENFGEGSLQRKVEVGHRNRQAEVYEAGHAMVGDTAWHDTGEVLEVGLDIDGDAVEANPAPEPDADRGDFVLGG